MRLNKLQRIGIVLSVAWAIGSGVHTHNADVQRARNFSDWAYKVCTQGKAMAHDADLTSCTRERDKNLQTWSAGTWGDVASTALIPVPFGWLAGFILLYVYRVQIVGFRSVVSWRTLSIPKRAAVGLCFVFAVGCVLVGIGELLGLYTSTEVPVALPVGGPQIYQQPQHAFITIEGTWTRGGMSSASSLAWPLQTSRIECVKESQKCTEARAYVANGLLETDLETYDIRSWTDAEVVFENDDLCFVETYRVNLIAKTVDGEGHRINDETDYCKNFGGNERTWTYVMTDGFKVYWAEYQKARPSLLKMFQSLFGN